MSQEAIFGFGHLLPKWAGVRACPTILAMVLGAATAVGLTSFGATPLSAGGKYPEEFKAAIKAQDQGEWKASIELIKSAVKKQPKEDGERVRIYGTRFENYLPHYYLGLALYKQGDCAGALKEWEQSLNDGAIQSTEMYESLSIYRSECQNGSVSGSN